MAYLLDTNVCIEYLRGRNDGVLRQIQARLPTDILLCSIVAGELFAGAARSPQGAANQARLARLFTQFNVLAYDLQAASLYGDIRTALEARGLPIGPYDMQIAAVALANDLNLVTHNTAEFSRVAGLRLEDWHI